MLQKLFRPVNLLAFVLSFGATEAYLATTGAKTGINHQTGYIPPRRDILDLYTDLPQWSIYIQALTAIMSVPEEELTSYFQIAGIHGRPYIAYDDVNATTPGGGVPIGYCTHGNILFPTWHRPYLALIEQVLVGFAVDIARGYRDRSFSEAAERLRLPYWDWAALPSRFPDLMTWPSVQIQTPTGLTNVTNPLFSYKFLSHPEPQSWFPTEDQFGDSFLGAQSTTIRWPDSTNTSRNSLVNINGFNDDGIYLSNAVFYTFSKSTDYNTMSTTANSGYSFEGPHGTVHGFVGGTNGHMSPVSFAGFDPSFWLHHANVDRLIAMWQAIYPDSWMVAEESSGATWTISYNEVVDENTSLTPFFQGDGSTPWTSSASRDTRVLGYSYLDVPTIADPVELAKNVTARVNSLYDPTGTLANSKRSMRVYRDVDAKEWFVEVEVPNAAIGVPFELGMFVGEVKLGRMTVMGGMSKEEIDAGVKRVSNAVFAARDGLIGVGEGDVEGVLKKGLRWEVVRSSDGAVIPNGEVKGLKVLVVDEIVTPPKDVTEFPIYGKKTEHPEII